MGERSTKSRPQFRNIHITQILHYRLPAAGVMSILHRVSGAAMFLLLPLIIWIFDLSLTSELSYVRLLEFTASPLVKLVLCGLAWAFIHHVLAGIRHLVSDMHIGLTREDSARWGTGVIAGALLLSIPAWLKIFGAF
jgi:succinate dehydrogenase / fumarate reductase cytochrome b subunit